MTSFHALAIPPLIRGMHNISAILKRAQASDLDAATILTSRIHPTMRPFTFQIKSLTDTVARIPNQINPSLPPSPLPDLEENPTFDILLSRIAAAISYIESIAPEDLNGREDADVKLRVDRKSWAGDVVYVEYQALEFVQIHAHPNFWFHVTTAYDLLRAAGLDIGKPDFLNAAGLKTWESRDE
ncbi:hypothetical protein DPSP01_000890 [Paraphaeosphaeria sporulosa]|uniref:Uncharacterized protein n=1 Tax=Paraphaeosphaeria sporulosa TaxID=1460663 RepID=A0A177CQ82_9PLEO|nr:uncharacterized protein CC84DRAFT_1255447 [Paraphaeosphaeria sporulosa]OAG09381.1 hypothetical protein CC84DRAFT_1255447 [Paraphaeosphaeria sporulosa]